MICPPDHKHGGSRNCYVRHQCRCQPCRDYAAQLGRERRRNAAYGRPTTDLIDAAQMQEHLHLLRDWGYGYRRLEAVTSIGQATIRRHLAGRCTRVRSDVAARVLAVRPTVEGLAPGAQIPARGTQRRLWALRRLGWNSADIARLLGCERESVAELYTRRRVTVRWHMQIDAVYEELCMVVAPVTPVRKRVMALAAGHPGPLDWDDIDMDPTPPVPPRLTRAIIRADREEAIIRLHALRYGDKRIAREVGIHPREVFRIRTDLGLPAWTREQQMEAA